MNIFRGGFLEKKIVKLQSYNVNKFSRIFKAVEVR